MKIGVIGLGYVGLPLAVGFAREGHSVVGIDTDPRQALLSRTVVEPSGPPRVLT